MQTSILKNSRQPLRDVTNLNISTISNNNSKSFLSTNNSKSNSNNNNVYLPYIQAFLLEFGTHIDLKVGDNAKFRQIVSFIMNELDNNIKIVIPTPSELRDDKKQVDRRKTMLINNIPYYGRINMIMGKDNKPKTSATGIDEDLLLMILDHLKLNFQINKRHLSITPQGRNWSVILMMIYNLCNIIKFGKIRDEMENFVDQHIKYDVFIFMSFINDIYVPWLEDNEDLMKRVENDWKKKMESDCRPLAENCAQLNNRYLNIRNQLEKYINKIPTLEELDQKTHYLENEYKTLNQSLTVNEQVLSTLVSNREVQLSQLNNLESHINTKKKENELLLKQIENQELSPLEVQSINREKTLLEEQEANIENRINYLNLELDKNRKHLNTFKQELLNSINNYNMKLLKTLNLSELIIQPMDDIEQIKLKRNVLVQKVNSLQEQIQQMNESCLLEEDHLNEINLKYEELEETLKQESELVKMKENELTHLKQQQRHELELYSKEKLKTEDQANQLREENIQLITSIEQSEEVIQQLTRQLNQLELEQKEEKEVMFHLIINTLSKVTDHKKNVMNVIGQVENVANHSFKTIQSLQFWYSNQNPYYFFFSTSPDNPRIMKFLTSDEVSSIFNRIPITKFSLEEIQKADALMESQRTVGKIVINM
ncbi:hypothetical protein ABK040_007284 [Willaertia magna]